MAKEKLNTDEAAVVKEEKKAAPKKTAAKSEATAKKEPVAKKAPAAKKTTDEAAKKEPVKKEVADVKETVKEAAPVKKEAVKARKSSATVSIKLVKSINGSKQDQVATAISLGLKKIGKVVVQPDNDATRGKIYKIKHLVKII